MTRNKNHWSESVGPGRTPWEDRVSNANKGVKITAVLAEKRAAGECVGAVPYGRAVEKFSKMLVPEWNELANMARARLLRNAGLSLRGIAKKLAEEGRFARSGKPFQAQQVKILLGEPQVVGRSKERA